jgi:aerobic-type carbon monoxide dehydrogenase small subunit (CoxS/CutS family)
MPDTLELRVNGVARSVTTEIDRSLLHVLREELALTGTKYGCGESQCGACTVLLDGVPTRSCVTPVSVAADREITTIEGLERDGKLHPVQQAFLDADAFQCAYCTSGMIMSAAGLLRKNPHPSREEIVRAMNGNMCRCCAYPRIIAAIESAAKAGAGGIA